MQLRRRHRLPRRDRLPLPVPDRPLRRWSLIRPTLLGASVPQPQHRRRLQPGISRSVELSISGERLARFLNDLAKLRPLPESLVIDNGPELTSKAIFEWAQANKGCVALQRAREADAERLRRRLQRKVPR